MSEENPENNGPKQYSPASPEELKQMADTIPADDKSIFDAFGENQSTIPGVIGGFIGLQDKKKNSILQRSNIDKEENTVVIALMGKTENGIRGGATDPPYTINPQKGQKHPTPKKHTNHRPNMRCST